MEYNKKMIEHSSLSLSSDKLGEIADILLKIPRRHKLIHPCEDRTRYSNVLDWLMMSISELKESYM